MMNSAEDTKFEVACPCCGARLTIDAQLGRILAHEAAPKPKRAADRDRLERISDVLEKQAAAREARFRESAEEEKIKPDLLARKFEEALKKSRGQPVKPDLRDIDLD
ncbi:MAG TPA: hypothetical protein VL523_05360 [Terriglobia bacterium]|nr:hypothetical protein [Terriglobia bacterium]